MTVPTERANYVQVIVAAALRPGGPLHQELSDLVSEASGIAMDALYMEGDDRGADYPYDHEKTVDDAAHLIGEAMFTATVAYLTEPTELHSVG